MKFFRLFILSCLVLHFSSAFAQRELTEDLIIQEDGEYTEEEGEVREQSVFDVIKTKTPTEELYCTKAKVIVLNKANAKSTELILEANKSQYFGNIQITAHHCVRTQMLDGVDSKLYVTIEEKNIEEDGVLLFQGWLFSSSISLSTFSHPYYELFVKECIK